MQIAMSLRLWTSGKFYGKFAYLYSQMTAEKEFKNFKFIENLSSLSNRLSLIENEDEYKFPSFAFFHKKCKYSFENMRLTVVDCCQEVSVFLSADSNSWNITQKNEDLW